MIKIHKFENIYGIRRLKGGEALDKLNVIYAPNGTAKTSISDALFNISNKNNEIGDVYGSLSPIDYEIEVDETTKATPNSFADFKVLKYSGTNAYELPDGDALSVLAISPTIQKAVQADLNKIQAGVKTIENSVLSLFPKNKVARAKKALAKIAGCSAENPKLFSYLAEKADFSAKTMVSKITIDDLLDLGEDQVGAAVANPDVQSGAADFLELSKKPIPNTKSIFDSEFSLEQLQKLYSTAIELHYFDADKKRVFRMAGVDYDAIAIKTVIDEAVNDVYGSSQGQDAFAKVKGVLNKNKKTQQAVLILERIPELLPRLVDYAGMMNAILVTLLGSSAAQCAVAVAEIKAAQKRIDSIRKTAVVDDQIYTKIWNKFSYRFKFDKFELKLTNRFDAEIGVSLPTFVKIVPGTDEEITNPADKRLSTGEIRTFYLINFILEVESARLEQKPLTIILDDAVDSFDYKNKYGFIDYLAEIASDPNLQLIVFTHNFDFYRSLIIAWGRQNCEQFFLYKQQSTGECALSSTKGRPYYLQVVDFNNWKNNPTRAQYLALIPFARNVLQLQSDSKNEDVKKIDAYLHFDSKISPELKIGSFQSLYSSVQLPEILKGDESYLGVLQNVAKEIVNSPDPTNETDLEKKICLGVFIRVFMEKVLVKRIANFNSSLLGDEIYGKTPTLINTAHENGLITDDEYGKMLEANIVAPSYVHANSFMYEPLIDVGAEKLIEIARWIDSIS